MLRRITNFCDVLLRIIFLEGGSVSLIKGICRSIFYSREKLASSDIKVDFAHLWHFCSPAIQSCVLRAVVLWQREKQTERLVSVSEVLFGSWLLILSNSTNMHKYWDGMLSSQTLCVVSGRVMKAWEADSDRLCGSERRTADPTLTTETGVSCIMLLLSFPHSSWFIWSFFGGLVSVHFSLARYFPSKVELLKHMNIISRKFMMFCAFFCIFLL